MPNGTVSVVGGVGVGVVAAVVPRMASVVTRLRRMARMKMVSVPAATLERFHQRQRHAVMT